MSEGEERPSWPTMRWFGESWGAFVCEPESHAKTPVERNCCGCGEPIQEGAQGLLAPYFGGAEDDPYVPFHLACFKKSVGIGE